MLSFVQRFASLILGTLSAFNRQRANAADGVSGGPPSGYKEMDASSFEKPSRPQQFSEHSTADAADLRGIIFF